ncbi:MAG: helix-turn-helix transcriptional regulator [Treponema sp.]|jgi:transcriptional regulator with XRE-family HTH domain|nr:helix-turn-helix transcriptional regulator [Treponema sp.]
MEKTENLKDILSKNLRENRRKCGFSQEQLAEKAGISTQYLAMIEIARKFPTSEVLERLARAMGIKVYELFLIDYSPREALERLEQSIIANIEQVVRKTIQDTLANGCEGKEKV